MSLVGNIIGENKKLKAEPYLVQEIEKKIYERNVQYGKNFFLSAWRFGLKKRIIDGYSKNNVFSFFVPEFKHPRNYQLFIILDDDVFFLDDRKIGLVADRLGIDSQKDLALLYLIMEKDRGVCEMDQDIVEYMMKDNSEGASFWWQIWNGVLVTIRSNYNRGWSGLQIEKDMYVGDYKPLLKK